MTELTYETHTTPQPADERSRWVALVVLCGLGIAWATGAGRLETPRARLTAYAMSVGGPLVLAAGVLAVAW